MITPTQSKLLTALLAGEQTRAELRAKTGVHASVSGTALSSLVLKGFITDEIVSRTRILEITHDGKRALKRFEKGEVEGPKAAPDTINRITGDYTPQAAYYRNGGNKHIPSYGYGC
jgi:DNA-binding MarR family transcriptional regulator